MNMDKNIYDKLDNAFSPLELKVINESHLHKGHAGDDGSGHSHYRVIIKSKNFAGHKLLERHRAINEVLKGELKNSIHALTIQAYSDEESANIL